MQFTMDAAMRDKLRRAQERLSHRLPSGDVKEIFDRALDALHLQLDEEENAATDHDARSAAAVAALSDAARACAIAQARAAAEQAGRAAGVTRRAPELRPGP